jgi:hypothetical protein
MASELDSQLFPPAVASCPRASYITWSATMTYFRCVRVVNSAVILIPLRATRRNVPRDSFLGNPLLSGQISFNRKC